MSIEEIHTICKKYGIRNYTINDDLSIDVYGSVEITNINSKELPLKFNKVTGNFICHSNNLTTLKGSPKYVGNDFSASFNLLTSLEYSPRIVGKGFYVHYNNLTSLEYSPIEVGYNFCCSGNQLTSLEGSPNSICEFRCNNNPLETLNGIPLNLSKSQLYLPNDYTYEDYLAYCRDSKFKKILK